MTGDGLLHAAEIRELAARLDLRPTKRLGQNFVVDANTVRRIVRLAEVSAQDAVVEVGPGLGSLTLALLETGAQVSAIEIDPVLAGALPQTVASLAPGRAERLQVLAADALTVEEIPGVSPTVLVANLPYNVSVPVLLHLLEHLPTLERGLVMVQLEVAQRIVAGPGSRTYGVPSAKTAWYAAARLVATVPRSVFWPVPHVDSALVAFARHTPPATRASRAEVFACIDAAFSQRRKTLRSALAGWAGSPARAEQALRAAGVDPSSRGEQLGIAEFAAVAASGTRLEPR